MAAPQVAGAVALCLQGSPRPLNCYEIRKLILNNTDLPVNLKQHPLRYGAGYLNVRKVVRAVSAIQAGDLFSSTISTPKHKHLVYSSEKNIMKPNIDRTLNRLEHIIERSDSRESSERNLLAEITYLGGKDDDLNYLDLDELYYEILNNSNDSLPQLIRENFKILARPRETLDTSLQKGDILLRIAKDEPGLGHLAVISDPNLMSYKQLLEKRYIPESVHEGYYTSVIEGGAFPHLMNDAFARQISDREGKILDDQVLLRPTKFHIEKEFEDERIIQEPQIEESESSSKNLKPSQGFTQQVFAVLRGGITQHENYNYHQPDQWQLSEEKPPKAQLLFSRYYNTFLD